MLFKTIRTVSLVCAAIISASSLMSVSHASQSAQPAQESNVNLAINGTFTQGALVRGQVDKGAEVFLNGERVETNKDGKFVIGFEREAPLEQQLVVKSASGDELIRDITLSKRQYDIQRIDGLEPKMVTPPESVSARIKQDNINVANARSGNSDLDALFTKFEWPASGPITGVYGSQRVLNGVPKWPHYGVDVGGPTGTPVYAPVDGVVTLAEDLYYSGNTLILDHGMTVFSTFLHLDSMTVDVGDLVKQGEQIGTIGATGRATGPHLDWRINLGTMRLDPQTVVLGTPNK